VIQVRVPLESLCTRISSGGTPSRRAAEYFTTDLAGHLWVKSKELLDRPIENTEERISDAGLKNSAAKYFPPNTVLVAMYGANVGQLAWLRKPATLNQAICGLIVDGAKADWRYVFYALLLHRNDLIVQAQGAAQQNLNSDLIKRFGIPLPPLPAQREIAETLMAYDELIENDLKRIPILEEMIRALYREWFIDLRFPGHDGVRHVPSSIGPIPENWTVVAFTELADVLSGGTPKTDVSAYWGGAIPFFTPRDATDTFYVNDTEKSLTELGLSKCSSSLFPADTVFITARGTVGKVALPSVAMALNQSCYALRGKDGISQRFLHQLVLQQVDFLRTNTGGATFETIVVDTFRCMQVVKPPADLVARFESAVAPMFDTAKALGARIAMLRHTRDLLLPWLLSGRAKPGGRVE
jgi:type I restriction enzyme S subunit